jgi:tetratricopeptide (TPR) repeat protein
VGLAESLVSAAGAAPLDRRTLARAYRDLADALRAAGDLEGALAAIEKGTPLVRERMKSEPDSLSARQSVAVVAIRTGDILMRRGDVARASELFREVVDIHRATARADPANGAVRDEIASASTRLCEALLLLKRTGDAGPVCREAYEITIESWREHPTDEYAWGAAIGHSWMAKWCEAKGDAAAARRHHAESLRIYEDLGRRRPTAEFRAGLAEGHRFMGDFLASQGARRAAADHLRQAIGHFEAMAEANPEDYENSLSLAGAAGAAARVVDRLGERAAACSLAAQAEAHFERLSARHPLPAPPARDRALLAPLLEACGPEDAVSPSAARRRGL